MKSLNFSLALLAGCVLSLPAAAAPQQYRLVPLKPPVVGQTAVARAISSNGWIAGEAFPGAPAPGNLPTNYGQVGALNSVFTGTTADATTSFVRGINDSGIGAGTAVGPTGNIAMTTGVGSFSTLVPIAGFANGGALGINNAGAVVGYSLVNGNFFGEGTARPVPASANVQRATVWNGGNATGLDNPFGNFASLATAINAAGQIVGVANDTGAQTPRAVIWNNGVVTALATPMGQQSTARAISSAGWVAGRTETSPGSFLATAWDGDGTAFSLASTAGCSLSDARGINSSNNVVGFSQGGPCGTGISSRGSYWDWNGAGYDVFEINSLVSNLGGWNLTAPQAINDLGQIVGFGLNESGINQGFLLQPVPEPGTWAMLIAGFGLVGAMRRRQRRALAQA